MLKNIFILIFLLPVAVLGQNLSSNGSQNNDVISNFEKLTTRQLSDIADYYYQKNIFDTALICYTLLINTPVKNIDIEQQNRMFAAYNRSAIIYRHFCDYKTSYELYIKALIFCEKDNNKAAEAIIYNNIGNIYTKFNRNDIAKEYYIGATVIINHLALGMS